VISRRHYSKYSFLRSFLLTSSRSNSLRMYSKSGMRFVLTGPVLRALGTGSFLGFSSVMLTLSGQLIQFFGTFFDFYDSFLGFTAGAGNIACFQLYVK